MSDPIAEAAAAVEEGDAHDLGGEGETTQPDLDDAEPDPTEVEEATDPLSRLMEPLEGSVKDDHIGELWNPEQGGANRLALVAEETFGVGDGLQRIAHVGIGVAELAAKPPGWIRERRGETDDRDDGGLGGDHDEGDTREVLDV